MFQIKQALLGSGLILSSEILRIFNLEHIQSNSECYFQTEMLEKRGSNQYVTKYFYTSERSMGKCSSLSYPLKAVLAPPAADKLQYFHTSKPQ